MLLPPHLRRSRHGIYYFRIVLSAPIAAVLGQRELVRSLGIRSPKIARKSGYQLSLQITPILEGLQRIMAIDPNSIQEEIGEKLGSGLAFIHFHRFFHNPTNRSVINSKRLRNILHAVAAGGVSLRCSGVAVGHGDQHG